ncbi:MAG: LapA family protein [Bacteroidetes bacterium]|nr:LapA family protein [Bacteroidota bacterium]
MKLKNLNPRMVLILVLLCLLIIFSIQNSEIIQLKVFFWNVSIPRILLIMGSLIIGAFIGFLFPLKKK